MAASLGVAVLMLAGKLGAYAITGSTAILSDALESVVHLVATAAVALGLWYAALPPDRTHPYGHGKIAYFVSAFEGALILVAGLGIVAFAVADLLRGPQVEQLGAGLLITGGLALVNAALGLTLIHVGRRHNALILVSNGHHVLTDMWTSLGVIGGLALVWVTGQVWLDPAVAILVGLNILWTAGRLLVGGFHGLMEKADAEDSRRIAEALETARDHGQVEGWHQLRHRRVNDHVWVELHLLFPPDITLHEAHRRATVVEAALRALFPKDTVSVTSHLEPRTHEHPSTGHEPVGEAFTTSRP